MCISTWLTSCIMRFHEQLIPADVKFDPTSNPPQFSDNEGQVIEKGAHVRLKLVGTRSDVGKMSAIGSVKEVSEISYGLCESQSIFY